TASEADSRSTVTANVSEISPEKEGLPHHLLKSRTF
ncbi:unnamed protein product, partial [Allacma fusca]